MNAQQLLAAAGRRRLLRLVDVVDRLHVVRDEPGQVAVEDLSPADVRAVDQLAAGGLVQFGAVSEPVPWHGGTAYGVRVLPTEAGLAQVGGAA